MNKELPILKRESPNVQFYRAFTKSSTIFGLSDKMQCELKTLIMTKKKKASVNNKTYQEPIKGLLLYFVYEENISQTSCVVDWLLCNLSIFLFSK
jgi:hypothetical protein